MRSIKMTRRVMVRGLLGSVAVSGISVLEGPRAAQVTSPPAVDPALRIIEGTMPDFTDPRILGLLTSSNPVIFDSFGLPEGFAAGPVITLQSDERLATVSSSSGSAVRSDLTISGQQNRQYLVYEDGLHVNTINVEVLLERRVTLILGVQIGFNSSVSADDRKLWVDAVVAVAGQASNTDNSSALDFEGILLERVRVAGLNPSQVVLLIRFELRARGPVVVYGDPNQADSGIRQAAGGALPGSCIRVRNGRIEKLSDLKACFAERKMTYVLVSSDEPRLPQRNQGKPPAFVTENGSTPDQIADGVAKILAEKLKCKVDDQGGATHEIMTIGNYPEYKVQWRMETVYIRVRWRFIRFTISFDVPRAVTFKRTTTLKLISFSRWPAGSLNNAAIKAVTQCTLESALIGGVVGVWTLNPAAALTAFQGAFELCLREAKINGIRCLVPGLAVRTDRGGWQAQS